MASPTANFPTKSITEAYGEITPPTAKNRPSSNRPIELRPYFVYPRGLILLTRTHTYTTQATPFELDSACTKRPTFAKA